jgi:hypothetical protein
MTATAVLLLTIVAVVLGCGVCTIVRDLHDYRNRS